MNEHAVLTSNPTLGVSVVCRTKKLATSDAEKTKGPGIVSEKPVRRIEQISSVTSVLLLN